MRYCAGCEKTKGDHSFSKNASKRDGYNDQCKECAKGYQAGRKKSEAELKAALSKAGAIYENFERGRA